MVDGATPDSSGVVDAPVVDCVTTTTQLLMNGAFDATPKGTGWTETPIDPQFPLVTDLEGIVEQSAPFKAWLGGLSEANALDQLFQDVAIPAETSSIQVTGVYDVRSAEAAGAGVKDTGLLVLAELGGTVVDTVLALDNTQARPSGSPPWIALDKTITMAGLGGRSLRFKLSSANDAAANTQTSFYFDGLAVTATHCQ